MLSIGALRMLVSPPNSWKLLSFIYGSESWIHIEPLAKKLNVSNYTWLHATNLLSADV